MQTRMLYEEGVAQQPQARSSLTFTDALLEVASGPPEVLYQTAPAVLAKFQAYVRSTSDEEVHVEKQPAAPDTNPDAATDVSPMDVSQQGQGQDGGGDEPETFAFAFEGEEDWENTRALLAFTAMVSQRRLELRAAWEPPAPSAYDIIRGKFPAARVQKNLDSMLFVLQCFVRLVCAQNGDAESCEHCRRTDPCAGALYRNERKLCTNPSNVDLKDAKTIETDLRQTVKLGVPGSNLHSLTAASFWCVYMEDEDALYDFVQQTAARDAVVASLALVDRVLRLSHPVLTTDFEPYRYDDDPELLNARTWFHKYASLPLPEKAEEQIREWLVSFEVEPGEIDFLDAEEARAADALRIMKTTRPEETTDCFDRIGGALEQLVDNPVTQDRIILSMWHRYLVQQANGSFVQQSFATTKRPGLALARLKRHRRDLDGLKHPPPLLFEYHGKGEQDICF